jgi:hypothetical protein
MYSSTSGTLPMKLLKAGALFISFFASFVANKAAFGALEPVPVPMPAALEETSERLSNPFFLPQTNFYFGSSSYNLDISSTPTASFGHGEINTYGFDLEVNATRFLNLGAYMRAESLGSFTSGVSMFSTLVGGFTRFYYMPPFLSGKTVHTNLFLRLELGTGPVFFGLYNGFVGQGGAHLGAEVYFSKWVGVFFSYGKTLQAGGVTLGTGGSIWNEGSIFAGGLKTTFF